MTHPNIPNTPKILGLETPPLETPAIVISNLHFQEAMLLEAGPHFVMLNGENFFIQLLSFTSSGHLVLDYNGNHYEREVSNSMLVTLGGDIAQFADFS